MKEGTVTRMVKQVVRDGKIEEKKIQFYDLMKLHGATVRRATEIEMQIKQLAQDIEKEEQVKKFDKPNKEESA